MSFSSILTGKGAFYNRPDYHSVTRREMSSKGPIKDPVYRYQIEKKVWRIVKNIFAVIFFPVGLYKIIHCLIGRATLPASSPALMGFEPGHVDKLRKSVPVRGEWKVKRVSIQVDGYIVDVAIMGRPSTLANGRWVLYSNGNGEFYEDKLNDGSFKHILSKLNGNAILFNYPSVGASTGMPNRRAMSKAYRAVLSFLEDEKKGIGAKEIIGLGHSIGGGVQGDALRTHKLKPGIKYVFIKSRTFSELSKTAALITTRFVGLCSKIFGWNISSIASSKKLKAPEIIMQTANVSEYEDISAHPEKIIHDGIIPADASLAKRLINDEDCPKQNKYFMGYLKTTMRSYEILVILWIKLIRCLQAVLSLGSRALTHPFYKQLTFS